MKVYSNGKLIEREARPQGVFLNRNSGAYYAIAPYICLDNKEFRFNGYFTISEFFPFVSGRKDEGKIEDFLYQAGMRLNKPFNLHEMPCHADKAWLEEQVEAMLEEYAATMLKGRALKDMIIEEYAPEVNLLFSLNTPGIIIHNKGVDSCQYQDLVSQVRRLTTLPILNRPDSYITN